MSLTCLIVDDEPVALNILEDFIGRLPGLHLVARCSGAAEALPWMRAGGVDLLFTDIEMPGISGIELVSGDWQRLLVIFTTAYPDYALNGYELDVVDYLLKPISFQRFATAVEKARQRKAAANQLMQPAASDGFFYARSSHNLIRILYESVQYIQGLENYVRIHCDDRPVIALGTMQRMEAQLAPHGFLRIHRSYIVNTRRIDRLEASGIVVSGVALPVGASYRKRVSTMLRGRD